jgi:hypothetical protein
MESERKITKLIDNFGDAEALNSLTALGQAALPALHRAYKRLGDSHIMMAQWDNRILYAIAADPVGEALSLLGKVQECYYADLAWPLRRFAKPADAERIRQALELKHPSEALQAVLGIFNL